MREWTWQWSVAAILFWTLAGVVLAGFIPKTTARIHAIVVGAPAAAAKLRDAAVALEQRFK